MSRLDPAGGVGYGVGVKLTINTSIWGRAALLKAMLEGIVLVLGVGTQVAVLTGFRAAINCFTNLVVHNTRFTVLSSVGVGRYVKSGHGVKVGVGVEVVVMVMVGLTVGEKVKVPVMVDVGVLVEVDATMEEAMQKPKTKKIAKAKNFFMIFLHDRRMPD